MEKYKMLGLMSGTALDGLDLACCHIWENEGNWAFEIVEKASIPYTSEMQNRLNGAIHLSAENLLQFHNTYGTWLGEQAKSFISENRLNVDYIASHGHTTHHRPELGLTFQIGSGQHLANASGHKVICDFRTNDVALGGQGAPLVPIGDSLFFNTYDFCLNLGGISNISFEIKGKRIAYDIGMANMLLNYITRKIGLDYDENGKKASSGKLNPKMLQQLNDLEYYLLPHPKSTGYEWFREKVIPIVERTNDTIENLLHTSIHHICEKIAQQIALNPIKEKQRMLVTGGGAFNGFLIETLGQKLGSHTQVIVPDKTIIAYKEALIFALMGVLRMEKRTNVLSSVTGAKRNSSSGILFLPN
ncbi:anhydro-N-acetylmuramic acid kinase [Maribacter sp. 2304DJ31-5]|uniref:anhydro-N-acetylmuramic acid kinase n=1 Tax=Maribacter sp. 2304DJ31-5 TaxID=3386273 RepID=UPI0039BD388C